MYFYNKDNLMVNHPWRIHPTKFATTSRREIKSFLIKKIVVSGGTVGAGALGGGARVDRGLVELQLVDFALEAPDFVSLFLDLLLLLSHYLISTTKTLQK
jgi:hypothetical protein